MQNRVLEYFSLITLIILNYDAIFSFSGTGLSIGRILLFACLCAYFAKFTVARKQIVSRVSNLTIIAIVWIIYQCLSFLWSPIESQNVRYIFNFIVNIFTAVLTILTINRFYNEKKILNLVLITTITFSLAEILFGWRPSASRQWDFSNEIVGGYSNPLFMGYVMASLIIFVVVSISQKATPLLYAALIVLYTITPFVGSRTLVLIAIASLIPLIAVSRGNIKKIIGNISLALGILVPVYFAFTSYGLINLIPIQIIEKISTIPQIITDAESRGDTSRVQIFQSGVTLANDSIIYGFGLGSAEQVLSNDAYLVEIGGINPHNWWLEVVLNGGIISLSIFAIFLLNAFFTIKNRLEFESQAQIIKFAYIYIIIFPILVIGPSSISNFAFPWIMFGIIVSVVQPKPALEMEKL